MQILVKANHVIESAHSIIWGTFDEPIEKWALLDEEGNVRLYVIDDGYTVIENVELPSDYVDGKYFYEDGGFVLNEDWEEYVSPEEKIANLEKQVADLKSQLENLNGDAVWDEMAVAIEEGVNQA